VVSPIRELADSISGWLRRWARVRKSVHLTARKLARRYCWSCIPPLRQFSNPAWYGPRVLASSDGAHEPQFSGDGWKVNLNDLAAIQRAVSQAQGGATARIHSIEKPIRYDHYNYTYWWQKTTSSIS
jgi:two-component system capsular synthesis sensor histidine kinase RcsC